MKKHLIYLALTIFLSVPSFAQNADTTVTSNSITGQFDALMQSSNNYQDYKVIKKTSIERFKSNVLDSLNVFKNQLQTVNQDLAGQQSKIAGLEKEIADTKALLATAEAARDNFEFFGMPISKSAYNNLMWTIVFVLIAAFLFFLFKYSQSHKLISKAQKDLADTLEEFDQHRKNTLERERKLKRELVDAMNGKIN
jgi:ethanolamine utilization protein EutA (predicted chaperonin)